MSDKWNKIKPNTDSLIWLLIGCGIIIFPVIIRDILFEDSLELYYKINFFVAAAILIMLLTEQEHDLTDKIMIVVFAAAFCLFVLSTYNNKGKNVMPFLFNCLFPGYFIIFKFDKDSFKRMCKWILLVFDIFICLLVVVAIIEKLSGGVLLHFVDSNFNCSEIEKYVEFYSAEDRFYSIWGHALTNALLFNFFFIINDVYYHYRMQKYPKLIFFAIAFVGVLLCASKSAIVVLVLYFLISTFRDKRMLLLCLGVGVIVFLAGGANLLIQRFTTTPLTTGRFTVLKMVMEQGVYPLQLFKGYGMLTVFKDDFSWAKPAFEFPLLMYALDYGILFSLLMVGGIYCFVSYRLLKAKWVQAWLGFSLVYAELNIYNGMCLNNQDVFIWFCVFVMLMLNITDTWKAGQQKEIE